MSLIKLRRKKFNVNILSCCIAAFTLVTGCIACHRGLSCYKFGNISIFTATDCDCESLSRFAASLNELCDKQSQNKKYNLLTYTLYNYKLEPRNCHTEFFSFVFGQKQLWTRGLVWPDLAIYWTLGNFSEPLATINLPKSSTFLGNFCKVVKIYHFSSEILFGQVL